MPWNKNILAHFQTAIPGGDQDESKYYGPYNSVLQTIFPVDDGFMISPQYRYIVEPGRAGITNFPIFFIVEKREHPVFFLEVTAASHMDVNSARSAADEQMRQRVKDLHTKIIIPKLYGVSAIGTKIALYEYTKDTNRLEPSRIADDDTFVVDTAPTARWGSDVLTDAGEQLFRHVSENVKRMCNQLGQGWLGCLVPSHLSFTDDFQDI